MTENAVHQEWRVEEVDELVKRLFPTGVKVTSYDRKRGNVISEVEGMISARIHICNVPTDVIDIIVDNFDTQVGFPWTAALDVPPEGDRWQVEAGGIRFVVERI